MIPILCMSCGTHILNTDAIRLHFPLSGEMFDTVVENFILRPGYLNLDIFCPRCMAFPFYHDGTSKGFKGVGRYLKTFDANGKETMLDIDAIKEIYKNCNKKMVNSIEKANNIDITNNNKEFPCEECGSKKNFHKRTCSKFVKKVKTKKTEDNSVQNAPESINQARQEDNMPEWLIAKVEQGAPVVPQGTPPTEAELAELSKDRDSFFGKQMAREDLRDYRDEMKQ